MECTSPFNTRWNYIANIKLKGRFGFNNYAVVVLKIRYGWLDVAQSDGHNTAASSTPGAPFTNMD